MLSRTFIDIRQQFQMNSTRRKYSINDQEKKQFDLEVYRKAKEGVIDYGLYKGGAEGKGMRCKSFRDRNNGVILLLAIHYVYRKVFKGSGSTLLLEFDIEFPLKEFQGLPEEFRKLSTRSNVVAVLKEVVLRLGEIKEEVEVEIQMNRYINQYPFFRFALIVWCRTRSAEFLQKHRKQYQILLGNQRETFLDYEAQLRFNTLQILCHSFNIKLHLQTLHFTEKYGVLSKQPKEIVCFINQENSDMVYVEDTVMKDCETNSTDNSVEPLIIPAKPKSRFQIESSILSSLSPRSMNEGNYCPKCNNKIKFTRCTNCKEESGEKRKSNRLGEYVSLFKRCEACGNKEIIYKGDLCRKCEIGKV